MVQFTEMLYKKTRNVKAFSQADVNGGKLHLVSKMI